MEGGFLLFFFFFFFFYFYTDYAHAHTLHTQHTHARLTPPVHSQQGSAHAHTYTRQNLAPMNYPKPTIQKIETAGCMNKIGLSCLLAFGSRRMLCIAYVHGCDYAITKCREGLVKSA